MKTNKMMRAASGLLVATLLTTSVISGTFAKYVTQDSATDTARVAKWGVVAAVSGDLFGATYRKADDNSIASYNPGGIVDDWDGEGTVSSSVGASDFVVAPGTKNDTGMTLYVVGTPEVTTQITLDAAELAVPYDFNGTPVNEGTDYVNTTIFLEPGKYGIMVKYDGVVTKDNITNYYIQSEIGYQKAEAIDFSEDKDYYELHDEAFLDPAYNEYPYYPISWKLETGGPTQPLVTTSLADVNTGLKELFTDTIKPNTKNDKSAKLTWEWKYGEAFVDNNDEENIVEIDRLDTILGNMIAEHLNEKTAGEKIGSGDYDVVKLDDTDENKTKCTAVKYEEVLAAVVDEDDATTESANTVVVAKADNEIVACLTVSFNARLTVEQVD